jgi:hypothetical protein
MGKWASKTPMKFQCSWVWQIFMGKWASKTPMTFSIPQKVENLTKSQKVENLTTRVIVFFRFFFHGEMGSPNTHEISISPVLDIFHGEMG